MKQTGILFQPDMVRAILADRKTQTRRKIKNPERLEGLMGYNEESAWCPYGGPGDVLYVRETWAAHFMWNDVKPTAINWDGRNCLYYRADGDNPHAYTCNCKDHQRGIWRPSLFMPKAAARIWLEITGVRAERLNEISEEDAIAEGYTYKALHAMHEEAAGMNLMKMPDDPILWYSELWRKINGPGSWEKNEFVRAITFKRIEKP